MKQKKIHKKVRKVKRSRRTTKYPQKHLPRYPYPPFPPPHPDQPDRYPAPYPSQGPYPYPPPQYPVSYYYKPTIIRKKSDLLLILIFLVCISVYWLPYIISNFIGASFYFLSPKLAEVILGVALCVLTLALMVFLRQYLDRPSLKDYGLSTENLGNNLKLTIKLIFIIIEFTEGCVNTFHNKAIGG